MSEDNTITIAMLLAIVTEETTGKIICLDLATGYVNTACSVDTRFGNAMEINIHSVTEKRTSKCAVTLASKLLPAIAHNPKLLAESSVFVFDMEQCTSPLRSYGIFEIVTQGADLLVTYNSDVKFTNT